MAPENVQIIFSFLSFSPGIAWFLLLVFPQKDWAMRIFDVYLIVFSLIFSLLTIPEVPRLLPVIAAPTFAAINQLLSSEVGTLGAWSHMIFGDLWIGRWVIHDSMKNNLHFLMRVPFLFTIIFFGPLGLLAYLIYRMAFLRKFALV